MAVHGCGGVGLSAVMIAAAVGARVIAVDIRRERLESAERCGASVVINAADTDPIAAIRDMSHGGAHVSLDTLGSRTTCWNSVKCLRKRGRHVQVGLMLGSAADPPLPMSDVIANELEIIGSHGMQAFAFSRMLRMVSSGTLRPDLLISNHVTLTQAAALLPKMNEFPGNGMTVIDRMT